MQNLFGTHKENVHTLSAPLDALAPADLATATFGVGCFWTPDARFGIVEGVWRTRVGYAGGEYDNPIYRDLGDHTECFQVDFDPTVISYRELVDIVFASHNPVWRAEKPQYASLVLAHDDEQLEIAQDRSRRASAVLGRALATRIEPLRYFWVAEDHHQKYYLRTDRLLAAELKGAFDSDEAALRESTAAARINSYVAGDGTRAQLAREIDFLGLSELGRSRLIKNVTGGTGHADGPAID